jgi:hypothetical protein
MRIAAMAGPSRLTFATPVADSPLPRTDERVPRGFVGWKQKFESKIR